MKRTRRRAFLASMLVAAAFSFAAAREGGCSAAAADSVLLGDSSFAAPPSSPPAVPDRNALASLRARVGRRMIRAWSDSDSIEILHARFDSTGLGFDPAEQEGERWGTAWWQRGETEGPPPPRSPLAWQSIRRIEVRHSHRTLGVILGIVAVPVLVDVIAFNSQPDYRRHDPGARVAVGVGSILLTPVGALVGGYVGQLFPRWKCVWPREATGAHP